MVCCFKPSARKGLLGCLRGSWKELMGTLQDCRTLAFFNARTGFVFEAFLGMFWGVERWGRVSHHGVREAGQKV